MSFKYTDIATFVKELKYSSITAKSADYLLVLKQRCWVNCGKCYTIDESSYI